MEVRDAQRWAETDPVIDQTLREAADAGATLHHEDGGGVDPGLALHVFRRDGWRCRMCGTQEDLELDHIDGHPFATPDIPDMGGEDVAANLVVICHADQDRIHQADRELEGAE
jgi:hypothetical protein